MLKNLNERKERHFSVPIFFFLKKYIRNHKKHTNIVHVNQEKSHKIKTTLSKSIQNI